MTRTPTSLKLPFELGGSEIGFGVNHQLVGSNLRFLALPTKEECMFSPMKLIILIAVIAVVWYGFKAMGRMKAKAAKLNEANDQDNIEDNN